jgi:hypothetical protein
MSPVQRQRSGSLRSYRATFEAGCLLAAQKAQVTRLHGYALQVCPVVGQFEVLDPSTPMNCTKDVQLPAILVLSTVSVAELRTTGFGAFGASRNATGARASGDSDDALAQVALVRFRTTPAFALGHC